MAYQINRARRGVSPVPLFKRLEEIMSKREQRLIFRLSDKELRKVQKLADRAGMTVSEYLRYSSTHKKINVVDGLDDFSKELRAVGRNLNQLTRLCNQGKIQCLDLGSIKNKIAQITEKVSEFV